MNDYITNAFTRQDNKTNLEVNNLNVDCITSTNNNFELDSDGNLSVKSITTEQGGSSGNSLTEIMNAIYPVGAIYMSVSSTNPGLIFGGIWEQISGRFLLGAGNNGDGNNYIASNTGGSATHRLTIDEMPSHSHTFTRGTDGGGWFGVTGKELSADCPYVVQTTDTGGGQVHNNMPPYFVVYIWKRIS